MYQLLSHLFKRQIMRQSAPRHRFLLDRKVWVATLLLPILHFGLAKLSLSLSFQDGAAAVWPSAGLYLAAVLMLGNRAWLGILLSECIANSLLFYSNPFTISIVSGIALIDPLVVGLLVKRWIKHRNVLDRSQDVFKFIILLIPSPIISTTLAVTTLCLTGVTPWAAYSTTWATWITAVIAGLLVITPTLLSWLQPQQKPLSQQQWIEFILLLIVLSAICWLAFGLSYPMEYMLIPPLIWSAFRLRKQESTLLVLIVSTIAVWRTVHGVGSFVRESTSASLLLLQSFIAVVAITTFFLCAVITENAKAETRLKQANEELEMRVKERTAELQHKSNALEQTLQELHQTQAQMIQAEKMSSLGRMVAGVAHEINNPVGFIYGNLSHIDTYISDLMGLLDLYQADYPHPSTQIQEKISAIDLKFITEDLENILRSMHVGTERIREIVLSLRNFSRLDESEFKEVDIHEGINSTLMLLQNRLKATRHRPAIEVTKTYGQLPTVECYAGQLNQVFMNVLSNAIDALEESNQDLSFEEVVAHPNQIWIKTTAIENQRVQIAIKDNGTGISEATQSHLFDPFFTTKPVGKGTGLGLSISYKIVKDRHGGTLYCNSTLGTGTEFVIEIPIHQIGKETKK
jgi:two-component system, NtrC family, sensor kinase